MQRLKGKGKGKGKRIKLHILIIKKQVNFKCKLEKKDFKKKMHIKEIYKNVCCVGYEDATLLYNRMNSHKGSKPANIIRYRLVKFIGFLTKEQEFH